MGSALNELEVSAFAHLADEIGNARVVALGESSHYGAATFELKLKLVQYLHTELGFNRVILEAGLFSCAEAAAAMRLGASAQEAARLCLFERNFCFDGAYPLFEYSRQTLNGSHPLELSGMDPQLSGTAPRELLERRLEEVLGSPLEETQARAIEHLFSLELERSAEARRIDHNAVLSLLGRVRQRTGTRSMWERIVDGLLFLDEDHWNYQFAKLVTIEMAQLRDQQMAQNVLWWLSQRPQERVIVWGASIHLAQTHSGLDIPSASAQGYSRQNSVPSGQWLSDSLGDDYFAVAISAAGGWIGKKDGEWIEEVGSAARDALEQRQAGGGLRLLTRKDIPSGSSRALMIGGSQGTAKWAELFDAVLVLPSERPVERRPDCDR
jgi:erythromycin esterase